MRTKKPKSIPHNIRTSLEDLSTTHTVHLIFKILPKLRVMPAIGPTVTSVNPDHCIIADCREKILIDGDFMSYENVRRVMYLLHHDRTNSKSPTNITIGNHQEIVSYCGNPECIKHLEPEQRIKKSPYKPENYVTSSFGKSKRFKNTKPYDKFDADLNVINNATGTEYRVFPEGIISTERTQHETFVYLLTAGRMPVRETIIKCFKDPTELSDLNDIAIKKIRRKRDHVKEVENIIGDIITTEMRGGTNSRKKHIIDHGEFITKEDYNDFKNYKINEKKLDSWAIYTGANKPTFKKKSVHDLLEEQQALNEQEAMPKHAENGVITT